ncbi:hypothetical protein NCAS_0G02390 [Naumovozyma castellii]|uniref:phosphatidylinositol-3,4,5-trisphosphate 3-phosphatase n=1 Tax=Naumovozyma castellii TaxID=27288 RepID=G0VI91_NAUCA|nr:hypothetical protein NCAS_0G02390 [Naumovozyma castellii CBS 4309]CCC71126.1 hypothetical protein NCAS_0G02390 [Naumovozyma castellii CBS 4309]
MEKSQSWSDYIPKRPHASTIIRSLYSAPLKVHKNNFGLTLDLSYVQQNIIVCSYPVTKYPKLLYRNNLEDLITFLNLHHGINNWKIYNLKVERGIYDYTDGDLLSLIKQNESIHRDNSLAMTLLKKEAIRYNIEILDTMKSATDIEYEELLLKPYLLRKGWLDHAPPPFVLLQEIIDDINAFVSSMNPEKIAVLHCKMGKGRCGTIVIAFMMKFKDCSLESACQFFRVSRFKAGVSKGVTIASQLRYLKYHEMFLYYDPQYNELILKQLKKSHFKLESIQLMEPSSLIYSNTYLISIKFQTYNESRNGLTDLLILETDGDNQNQMKNKTLLLGNLDLDLNIHDIRVEFKLGTKNSQLINKFTAMASSSHCWFNLYFESLKCSTNSSEINFMLHELYHEQRTGQQFYFCIRWEELDGTKGSNSKGLKLFNSINIKWSIY